jgi:hypothetical protein
MVLAQNDNGEIDFDSLTLVDFGAARTPQQRLEKPLFVDLASPDAVYLSPALREAIQRDWSTYGKLVGETGKSTWYEFSEAARRQYESVLMPDLAVNALDWRVDLYALGHWFKQISLHRIDYYKDTHQAQLPALIKKMQKALLGGGFTSLEACIKAFEMLEVDKRKLVVTDPPQTSGVYTMQPTPVLHPSGMAGPTFSPKMDDEFSPAPIGMVRREARPLPPNGRGKLVGIGIGLILVAAVGAALLRSKDQHSGNAQTASDVHSPAVTALATASMATGQPNSAAESPAEPATPIAPEPTALAGLSITDLQHAAEQGDAAAQTQLGLRYRKGEGVAPDNTKAVEWYRKAAEQNHAEAQAYLGFMYMTGRGIRRDDAEAVRYSRLAAEQGNPVGQFNLGLMYLSGRGVPASKIDGYRWLKKAAAQDPADAPRLAEVKRTLTAAELAQAESP